MASCTISGNVGSDVELKVGTKGGYIAGFSLAVDGGRDVESGQRRTTWYRVSCFGSMAESAERMIKKGDKIECVGYPFLDEFERKDGSPGCQAKFNAFSFNRIKTVSEPLVAAAAEQGAAKVDK